MNFSHRPICC